MKRLSLLFCFVWLVVVSAKSQTGFCIYDNGTATPIFVDPDDYEGVIRAARDLADDIGKVTGKSADVAMATTANIRRGGKRAMHRIIVGTIGNSRMIDELAAAGIIDVDAVRGHWESYIITPTEQGDLVVVGSDKRGTIYGIYDISERIGVSPWYWWTDVPVQHRDKVYWTEETVVQPSPKVKYRGIFINDEWPSFGTWATEHFGGINSQMYSKMFELLLRLKANYLWPAMWDSRFNEDDPMSPQVADMYGIVMGTSHHEPMMRAHKEYVYRKDSIGAWDYASNKENLDRFFEEGIERNHIYENIITIGMRGDGDVAMGKGDDEENMRVLKEVVDAQRDIISRVYGCDASEVPQLWAIFTEVQRYYDAGFTVPDDVTLLFCDNNWGYIRRTGPEKERNRVGGMGLYYHIDMNGGPWNDRWINTTTPAKLREQLNLAYQTGLDRIWIINVGDLKPKEMPIDFIMRYAWDPDAYPADKMDDYLERWAESIFGHEYAGEIAKLVEGYSKKNLERKPEVQRVGIYSAPYEALHAFNIWDTLESRALNLAKNISPEMYDAYFQLVEYPVVASAGVAKMYLAATLNNYYADKDEVLTRKYADIARQLFERDKVLTDKYNKEIAGGKWDGMMLDKHIGYSQWFMPEDNIMPELKEPDMELIKIYAESHTCCNDGEYICQCQMPESAPTRDSVASNREICIMAHRYTRNIPGNAARWVFLPGLGRESGNMGIEPVKAPSDTTGAGPTLEYDVKFDTPGQHILALGILPTNDVNPARGLRVGVRIDDGNLIMVDARQGYVDTFNEYNSENISRSGVLKPLPSPAVSLSVAGYGQPMRNEIFDNLRWLEIPFEIGVSGKHIVKIVMIDPEIVVEKLIIDPDNNHPTYYGRD